MRRSYLFAITVLFTVPYVYSMKKEDVDNDRAPCLVKECSSSVTALTVDDDAKHSHWP